MMTVSLLVVGDLDISCKFWLVSVSHTDNNLKTANFHWFTLLQEVNNVLVIVTRYFGGIHLGPDRFKHINQAARNALEMGGFLDMSETKKTQGRVKKH